MRKASLIVALTVRKRLTSVGDGASRCVWPFRFMGRTQPPHRSSRQRLRRAGANALHSDGTRDASAVAADHMWVSPEHSTSRFSPDFLHTRLARDLIYKVQPLGAQSRSPCFIQRATTSRT